MFKDEEKTIGELLGSAVQKMGEPIEIVSLFVGNGSVNS